MEVFKLLQLCDYILKSCLYKYLVKLVLNFQLPLPMLENTYILAIITGAEKPPIQNQISTQERVQENQGKPMQIPTEEICHAAQGMPLVHQQRMIATSKVEKAEDSSSKLTQPSPAQTMKSKHPKPG